MTYQQNIPAAVDKISQSQVDIQQNFQQLDSRFANDHVAFSVNVNPGLHKQVSIPVVRLDPVLVAPAGMFYTKAVAGVTEAFFSNGTTVSQLTGLPTDVTGDGSVAFVNGVIMKWGVLSTSGAPAPATRNVTFQVPFPINCYNVQLTGVLNNLDVTEKTAAVRSGTLTAAGFSMQLSSNSIGQVFWFAIGN